MTLVETRQQVQPAAERFYGEQYAVRVLYGASNELVQASAEQLLQKNVETLRGEYIPLHLIVDDSPTDKGHGEWLAQNIINSPQGQQSAITVAARLIDGHVAYFVTDGYHRVEAGRIVGMPTMRAEVYYGMTDDEITDKRTAAANNVEAVKFARRAMWITQSHMRSEWYARGLSAYEVLCLGHKVVKPINGVYINDRGVEVEISKADIRQMNEWTDKQALNWKIKAGALVNDFEIIDAASPRLTMNVVSGAGGSTNGRGVLNRERLKVMALGLEQTKTVRNKKERYELQERMWKEIGEPYNILANQLSIFAQKISTAIIEGRDEDAEMIFHDPFGTLRRAKQTNGQRSNGHTKSKLQLAIDTTQAHEQTIQNLTQQVATLTASQIHPDTLTDWQQQLAGYHQLQQNYQESLQTIQQLQQQIEAFTTQQSGLVDEKVLESVQNQLAQQTAINEQLLIDMGKMEDELEELRTNGTAYERTIYTNGTNEETADLRRQISDLTTRLGAAETYTANPTGDKYAQIRKTQLDRLEKAYGIDGTVPDWWLVLQLPTTEKQMKLTALEADIVYLMTQGFGVLALQKRLDLSEEVILMQQQSAVKKLVAYRKVVANLNNSV